MSLADWKEREKEQRRNDILDAALKLFHTKGYDNVSMSDIAEVVGIKKPTLYLYFKNKESLFFAIVIRGSRLRNAMAREELGDCTTGHKKHGSIARAISQFYDKYPEYSWADHYFRSGRFDLDTSNEDIKKILDLQVKMFDMISFNIRTAMDDDRVILDVDPLIAAVWMAMVTECTNNIHPDYKHVLESGGIDREKFIADTARLMRRAIMKEDTG